MLIIPLLPILPDPLLVIQMFWFKPRGLQEMVIKTLNERQALDTTRSHLEEVERWHAQAFSVNGIP